MPNLWATAPPTRKPLASIPATSSAPAAMFGQRCSDDGQAVRIGEYRRQILELDPRLRKVGDLAGQRLDDGE